MNHDAVNHAKSHRRVKISTLLAVLHCLPPEAVRVWANPVTGSLMVIDEDDNDLGYIDMNGRPMFYAALD